MKHTFLVLCLSLVQFHFVWAGPNPLLSRGKTVYTSKGNANYLTDNKFANSNWSVSNNSWLAINIGSGHNSVFFTWNNPNYTWSDAIAAGNSCKQNVATAVNYTIQSSS